jgi:hypothetical protein
MGEWRSKGNQSIIYGKHPSGTRYQILTQGKPVTIKFEEIKWPDGWTANFLKANEPPPKEDSKETKDAKNKKDAKHELIEASVARIPGAVAHQGGHSQTYTVACALTWGFALSEAEALPYFEAYNARCEPPWSGKDLHHKLSESIKDTTHKKPRGHLLRDDKDATDDKKADEDREMTGGSILDFANAPVDTTATLLGDQWST